VVVQLNICAKSLFGWLCRFDGDGYVALIHCRFWFFLYSSLHIYIERDTYTHERSSSYDVMVFVDLTSYVLCPNALYNVERNQSNVCLFHNFLLAVEWVKCLVFPFSSLSRLVDNSLPSFTWNCCYSQCWGFLMFSALTWNLKWALSLLCS